MTERSSDISPKQTSTNSKNSSLRKWNHQIPQSVAATDPYALHLDFDAGSGAGSEYDEVIEAHEMSDDDGRALTRTMFEPYGGDADGNNLRRFRIKRDGEDIDRWEWLFKLQKGMRADDEEVTKRVGHAQLSRDAETFCCQLELPQHQRDRVIQILDNIEDYRDFGGGVKGETIVLAIISLVVNKEGLMIRRYDTFKQQDADDPPEQTQFEELRTVCRVPKSNINTARQNLREYEGVSL